MVPADDRQRDGEGRAADCEDQPERLTGPSPSDVNPDSAEAEDKKYPPADDYRAGVVQPLALVPVHAHLAPTRPCPPDHK